MRAFSVKSLYLTITITFLWSYSISKQVYASQPMVASDLKSLIQSCTPSGYHSLLFKVVKKESSKRPYVIQINGAHLSRQPSNKDEAIQLIQSLKLSDYTFDIGLAQINSQHFQPGRIFSNLGYVPEDALDPCLNLQMSAALIDEAFSRTGSLVQALSIYNTGSPVRGIRNGYVRAVLNQPS